MVYVFTYIYRKNQPNVGKCTIHGSYGLYIVPHNGLFIYPKQPRISFIAHLGALGCHSPLSRHGKPGFGTSQVRSTDPRKFGLFGGMKGGEGAVKTIKPPEIPMICPKAMTLKMRYIILFCFARWHGKNSIHFFREWSYKFKLLIFKGQFDVPLTVNPWYLLLSL